jgi:methanogenic corrinoid protein MtbC1
MSQLYPRIFAVPKHHRRMVASCVGGELHEMGVRMVADFFELDGWRTYYLGANMPLKGVLAALAERSAHRLALSATLISHVPDVARMIAGVRSSEMGARVKILVGGRPFNTAPTLWRQIGADGYARDAAEALVVANSLLLKP